MIFILTLRLVIFGGIFIDSDFVDDYGSIVNQKYFITDEVTATLICSNGRFEAYFLKDGKLFSKRTLDLNFVRVENRHIQGELEAYASKDVFFLLDLPTEKRFKIKTKTRELDCHRDGDSLECQIIVNYDCGEGTGSTFYTTKYFGVRREGNVNFCESAKTIVSQNCETEIFFTQISTVDDSDMLEYMGDIFSNM